MSRNWWAVVAVVLLLSGCASKTPPSDESVAWRLQSLEESFLAFKENQREQKARLDKMDRHLDSRFEEMDSRLDVLMQEIEGLEDTAMELAERPVPAAPSPMEDEETVGEAMTSAAATQKTMAAPPAPRKASPEKALYEQALAQVLAENFGKGRELFDDFIATYPDSELLPNALYWLGETYYGEKRYAQSILTFKEVTRRFPKHHKAADALLKIGYAYDKLGDEDNAAFYLKALVDEYPDEDPVRLARQKLKTLSPQ